MAHSVDPDEEMSHLDLHCLQTCLCRSAGENRGKVAAVAAFNLDLVCLSECLE